MDTTTEPPVADAHATVEDPPVRMRLRRSRDRRLLAGVARGVADRYDVDVSLVRVAFVVLACLSGLGLIVYAAMWALVPAAAQGAAPVVADDDGEPTPSWLAFLLLGGVLAFGILVVSSWWGGPRWGGTVGLLWLVLLLGIVAVVIGGSSRRTTLRRAAGWLLLGVLSCAILAAGAFAGLVASTGVPFTGGIGDRVDAPITLGQLRATYRLAAGDLTVDLRRIHFGPGAPRHVTATVAVGIVTVDVPRGVVVDVDAQCGVGSVITSSGSVDAFESPSATASPRHAPQLVLTVDAGIGQVRLVRA